MIKHEIRIFFTALMFFTRIPCPAWVDHDAEYLQKASRYFPLMGFIVGGFAAGVFWLSTFVFPGVVLPLLLSTAASIWLTGAFHEDGFADVCDGFGGGWTAERILDIMKDSRLGTYGVTGLGLILSLKLVSLSYIQPELIPLVLIVGHIVSRANSTLMISSLHYARTDDKSKSKPLSTRLSNGSLVFVLACSLPWFFWPHLHWAWTLLPLLLVHLYLRSYFKKWIDGYTGDCLGALQQVSELVFYLSVLSLTTTDWPTLTGFFS